MVSESYKRNRVQELFEAERVRRGLTWEALGEAAGRSGSNVHDFINKPWVRLPTLDLVNALADALDVSREVVHGLVVESAGYTAGPVEFEVPDWIAAGYARLLEADPVERERSERLLHLAFESVAAAETKPRKRAPSRNGR